MMLRYVRLVQWHYYRRTRNNLHLAAAACLTGTACGFRSSPVIIDVFNWESTKIDSLGWHFLDGARLCARPALSITIVAATANGSRHGQTKHVPAIYAIFACDAMKPRGSDSSLGDPFGVMFYSDHGNLDPASDTPINAIRRRMPIAGGYSFYAQGMSSIRAVNRHLDRPV